MRFQYPPYRETINVTIGVFKAPVCVQEQSKRCCLCCMIGPVALEATLERSAYCCGENIKLKCEIQNGSDQNVWVIVRLFQVSLLQYLSQCNIQNRFIGKLRLLSWLYTRIV